MHRHRGERKTTSAFTGEFMKHVQVRPQYRLKQFCEEFGIGRTQAYLEIQAGRLRVFKVGKLTMVAGEDALAWRDSHRNIQPQRAA